MNTSRPILVVVPPPAAAAPAPARTVPTLAADVEPGRSWTGRVFALAMLAATLGGLSWLAGQIYYVVTDAWVAPLHLSPDSDQIQNMRLSHQRRLDELTRIDAEVTRIDGALAAIDTAVARLSSLRGSSAESLKWQAEKARIEVASLDTSVELLRRQRTQIVELQARQAALIARARADLAAGVTDRSVVDREELAGDQLALELTELDRQLAETELREAQARVALRGYRSGAGAGGAPPEIGQMPDVVKGDERELRIELEILRLEADARGHRALRAAALEGLARERELLAELEARPLHRAMKAATDVAFVPYDQLDAVAAGARVLDCTWGVFACSQVGVVGEVLPGEVVTQDPWGELARGQYVVLVLSDESAVRERVLRVRR